MPLWLLQVKDWPCRVRPQPFSSFFVSVSLWRSQFIKAYDIQRADDLVRAIVDEISDEMAVNAGRKRLTKRDFPELKQYISGYMTQLPEYIGCLPMELRAV